MIEPESGDMSAEPDGLHPGRSLPCWTLCIVARCSRGVQGPHGGPVCVPGCSHVIGNVGRHVSLCVLLRNVLSAGTLHP